MGHAIEQIGFPTSRKYVSGYAALLRIIVSQQVSNEAGTSIWKKLERRLRVVTAEKVSRVHEKTLRECGLSRPKVRYAKILAHAVKSGELDLKQLDSYSDEKVRWVLTGFTGIGPWTAEIYLMFALGRPDVFPSGDLALAIAVKNMLKLLEKPEPVELAIIAERWRPYRTAASIMLWHYYRCMPPP